MDFETTHTTIDRLVSQITSSELVLPEFQRNFIWSPSRVAELLDSVARGWPTGALLLLEGPPELQVRKFSFAPELRGVETTLVLDGQQRITALFHAFRDVSDICYCVDFQALTEDSAEFIVWKRRKTLNREYKTQKDRASAGLALVSEVADGGAFVDWTSFVASDVAKHYHRLRETKLKGLHSQVYKMPVIKLGKGIDMAALARIFETINRTGVRLNAFDLMVAVLYPHNFNLRTRWEEAKAKHEPLRRYEVDGIEILKLIALEQWLEARRKGNPTEIKGVRQADVLAIAPKAITRTWSSSIQKYVQALEYLDSEFGVAFGEIVPADAMVLTLGVLLAENVKKSAISEWYWASVGAQTYSQGANTRPLTDVTRLILDGTKLPFAASDVEFGLYEPVRRSTAIVRGLHGLLRKRKALDPFSGKPLNTGLTDFVTLQSLTGAETDDDAVCDTLFYLRSSEKRVRELENEGNLDVRELSEEALRSQGFRGRLRLIGDDWRNSRVVQLAEWMLEARGGK